MKVSDLKRIIREELNKVMEDKSPEEIAADKDAIDAEIEAAKKKIDAQKKKIASLIKQKNSIKA